MPIPLGLRNCVEWEAKRGIGWEDICTALQVPPELRDDVRRIVLGLEKGNDDEEETEQPITTGCAFR